MFHFTKPFTVSAIAALALATPAQAEPIGHVNDDGAVFAEIETADQAIIYANLQNLAARWNNIVILADTGSEQLDLMRESGVFADDFTITFNLPTGGQQSLTGLDTDEARAFYDQVVNGVGQRLNVSSNIEVLEFTADGARARFKYLSIVDGENAWGGENVVTIGQRNGRTVVTSSEIFLLIANTPGLKE